MKKRIIAGVMAAVMCCGMFTGCGSGKKKTINVYSSAEDYRNETVQKMLNEKFPEYDIKVTYSTTGDLAAKVAAEGKDTDIDIIYEIATLNAEKLKDNFATLDNVDYSVFKDEYVPADKKYVPELLLSGSTIINKKMLDEKGVPISTSYDDLLKPEYKGLVSMPNPKSSGTGYIFLLNLVNERGEDAAFEYFDKLADNMSGQGFTSSGSGPIKALVQGEAAIALGITYQAAEEIDKGSDFTITYFKEGAPYTTYASAVIAGKEKDKDIMKVFDYIVSDVSPEDKRLYSPEKIYKNQETVMKSFPQDVPYGNMDGINDIQKKEALLDKWNH